MDLLGNPGQPLEHARQYESGQFVHCGVAISVVL